MSRKTFRHTFILKFVWTHVVTYLVFGLFFMVISRYFDFFAADPLLSQVMRPQDSLWVRLAVPFQFVRGSLLALAIYPFATIVLERKYGWLKLAWLLWVLTSIGAVITGPGSIEGFLYTKLTISNPLIGLPEVIVQIIVFSYVFSRWMLKDGKYISVAK